ncbi:hypothetical protein BJX68DRAFT_5249 [Aspergillus pseudodeflectus]|uniref:Uncharacterized protein n=1 Tax=Aspergillus pseudodeflectus TaxID=176178 RepID=A0ABR4LA89_9EURO
MQHTRGQESELARTLSRSRSRSCSTSISSDSQLSRIHLFAPPSVNPPPSFIAPSSASQIITTDQEFNAADFVADDDDDSGALVTAEALSALNGFLDHLLFNILASAKSTQLASIRPAVADVLKPRLAKEVVSVADEELSEYLGEPEDEQIEFRGGQTPNGEFDLVRTWKLTRLRCMVYTRLGDMEEDDEEEYISQEGLADDEGAPRRFTNHIGNITPAAAIFLTSIIEHIGEQALVIAGETARSRLSPRLVSERDENEELEKERGSMNHLVVEELDMEKLALNPTLGRLWRTWRKRTRTPNLSRMTSRDSIRRRGTIGHILHSRKSSFSVADDAQSQISTLVEEKTIVDPASVPLPVDENDVQELEDPDLSPDMEGGDIQTMQAVIAHKVRPHSLMVLTLQSPRTPTSRASSPATPVARSTSATRHTRSRSLPSAPYPPDVQEKVPEPDQASRRPSPTASEERRRLETMYEEREETEKAGKDEKETFDAQKVEARPATAGASHEVAKQDWPLQTPDSNSLAENRIRNTAQETTRRPTEIVTDLVPSGPQAPSTFFIGNDTEVIEGQGMVEKPSLTSVQRPKRKPSKDVTKDQRSITSAPFSTDLVATAAVVYPTDKQSDDVSTSVHPVPVRTSSSELSASLPPTPVREVRPSLESVRGSRPASNSGDSVRSNYSRTYHRPSPLVLTNGNHRSPTSSVSSSMTERAAVQRISTRPSTSAAPSIQTTTLTKPRRSGSFGSHREKRPMTAGSTTSQVSTKLKGLISRPAEPAPLRLRSSSETSRASATAGGGSYDDTTGLDELIRSEETLHYTLTPRSVREMDFPDAPKWKAQRSHTAELADFLKSNGPDDAPNSPNQSNTKAMVPRRVTSDAQPSPKSRAIDVPKHSPIHAVSIPNRQKTKAPQPRDARPSLESSSDFAQFIRNSGPSSPTATSPSATIKSAPDRRFSDATELSKRPSRADSSVSRMSARGPRLQARPAAVPKGEVTSDLIDFIREGPPTVGARRIPRTVAPFRSTMDSDDLNYEQGTPSVTSTQGESIATKSQISVSSRTGLLESANGASVRAGPPKVQPSSSARSNDEDPRPKRTQRRVPDPYAIDWDDDEFELMLEEPKPKREEESLIDFLRNVPPPQAEPQTQPVALSNPPSKAVTGGLGGASGMKARLLRSSSSEKTPSLKSSKNSLRYQPDQHSIGSSNYTTKVGAERRTGASYGLAAVTERQTETSALADFLRNTGPPEPPTPRAPPPKESSFSRRLFIRRKKVEA